MESTGLTSIVRPVVHHVGNPLSGSALVITLVFFGMNSACSSAIRPLSWLSVNNGTTAGARPAIGSSNSRSPKSSFTPTSVSQSTPSNKPCVNAGTTRHEHDADASSPNVSCTFTRPCTGINSPDAVRKNVLGLASPADRSCRPSFCTKSVLIILRAAPLSTYTRPSHSWKCGSEPCAGSTRPAVSRHSWQPVLPKRGVPTSPVTAGGRTERGMPMLSIALSRACTIALVDDLSESPVVVARIETGSSSPTSIRAVPCPADSVGPSPSHGIRLPFS